MVFAIGAGVGVAAILGTLRFIKDWSIKYMIYALIAPTIGCACYMQWGNPALQPVIGMAWDCGAVTTGPVTVPILLALGIGVMTSSRKRRLARAAMQASVQDGAGQALEGFGIVTLASLLPVLAVELMGIIDSLVYSTEQVQATAVEAAARPRSTAAADTSPLKEVIYGVRSIMPLCIVLIFLVVAVLRRPLPECTFWMDAEHDEAEASVRGGAGFATAGGLERASMAIGKTLQRSESQSSIGDTDGESTSGEGSARGGDAAAAALEAAASGGSDADAEAFATPGDPEAAEGGAAAAAKLASARRKTDATVAAAAAKLALPAPAPKKGGTRLGGWFRRNAPLLGGIAVCQVGMILFNWGLTYGFTRLGDLTGRTLPAAYLEVPYNPNSPYYSYAGGLILLLVVVFVLGVLATRAEPALNVLGRTVEKLSGGAFTARMLIGAVCVGVGAGMVVGAVKVLFQGASLIPAGCLFVITY